MNRSPHVGPRRRTLELIANQPLFLDGAIEIMIWVLSEGGTTIEFEGIHRQYSTGGCPSAIEANDKDISWARGADVQVCD